MFSGGKVAQHSKAHIKTLSKDMDSWSLGRQHLAHLLCNHSNAYVAM